MHRSCNAVLSKTVLLVMSILCGLFSAPSAATHSEAPSSAEQQINVAVLAFRGSAKALQRWAPTMDYLSHRIPGHTFTAVPMTLEELDRAVVAGSVDFAITNAGQYVRVGSRHGMSWLATLKSRRHHGRGPVIGSALVVRADAGWQTLDALDGRRLGAVGPLAFGGFQIYWGEMLRLGYRPEQFFAEIKFSGFPAGVLAFWVRDNVVDAAVMPACLLETMAEEGLIDIDRFRVIGARQPEGFACQTSTELYPNWSFSTLKHTSAVVAEEVAEALLQMDAESLSARAAGSLGWTAPVSTYDIHQLYQQLEIHPWQQPWWQEMRRWLLQNWQWSLVILMLMVVGFLHHLWVQFMVQKRTRELQQTSDELLHQQHLLEHAQRVAILGELSSDLAHELNQPLAAINSYAEGGIVRLERADDGHDFSGLLQRISREARRGADIISRIRGFARQQEARRERTDLGVLISETLTLLDYELKKHGPELHLQLPEQVLIAEVDPVEIQQVLVNLIRNSLEAMRLCESRRLQISATALDAGMISVQVSDSGQGIDDAQVDELFKPFYSTRPEGLGLGMAICKRIVEAHGGTIDMRSAKAGGTVVTFTLMEKSDD